MLRVTKRLPSTPLLSTLGVGAPALALIGLLAASAPAAAEPGAAPSSTDLALSAASELAERPLPFVESRDELTGEPLFRVVGQAGSPEFGPEGIDFTLASRAEDGAVRDSLGLRFIDPARDAWLEAGDELPGKINRYVGSDPSRWQVGVSTYDGLSYRGLYPGIDLTYGTSRGSLKGTYHLAREADPGQIRWRYQEAASLVIDPESGDLVVTTGSGERLIEQAPTAWQEIDGERREVPVAFRIDPDDGVGFTLGDYDPTFPLTIDPRFVFETTYDAGGLDFGEQLTVDGDGDVYVVGRAANTPPNIVILKLRGSDGAVLFSTFLGGSVFNNATDIVHDDRGHVAVTGWTTSPDFPTVNALYPDPMGSGDAFVTQLSDEDGSIVWSTYFGGNNSDNGFAIASDARGSIVVAGATASTDFPATPNAVQGQLNLKVCFCRDGFVAKLSNDGQEVLYGTFLGGSKTERLYALDLDPHGNYFVAGVTDSADLPLVNAVDETYGGSTDGFVARISADGSNLDYSTYLGGEDPEVIGGIAVDRRGRAHVVGSTESIDFPTTPNAYQPNFVGAILGCGSPPFEPLHNCPDGFVTKLAPMGREMAFSTFLAGPGIDSASGVAVGAEGRVFVIGRAAGADISALGRAGRRLIGKLTFESGSATSGRAILERDLSLYLTGSRGVPQDIYVGRLRLGD